MAIFGVGSKWDNYEEAKNLFFAEEKFILGWDEASAKDLYAFVASLKVGDILYIKANQPGSRCIQVKGIGIVTKSLIGCIKEMESESLRMLYNEKSLFVRVRWFHRDEFDIEIPNSEGKLTNIRAATIYEEYLPVVQDAILAKIFNTEPTDP
jgi:hypothetical protein